MEIERKGIDHPLAVVLMTGMLVSVTMMLIGVALFALGIGPHLLRVLPFRMAVAEAFRLHAAGWMSLGLLVLILTPVARVVMAVLSFAWIRDWRYVGVSAVVLIAMVIGMIVEGR